MNHIFLSHAEAQRESRVWSKYMKTTVNVDKYLIVFNHVEMLHKSSLHRFQGILG
jgi:hypothetical protein